jgi:hypothetical protein
MLYLVRKIQLRDWLILEMCYSMFQNSRVFNSVAIEM